MDRLEKAMAALTDHINGHGDEGPRNGFVQLAHELGMDSDDVPAGADINLSFTLKDGRKSLTLSYMLVPVEEGESMEEQYALFLRDNDNCRPTREWRFLDGAVAEPERISA